MTRSRSGRPRPSSPPLRVGPRHVRGNNPALVTTTSAAAHYIDPDMTQEIPVVLGTQEIPAVSRTTGVLRSSAIMAAGTLVSRLLGFVRVWLLSVAIGISYDAANAFQFANTLPNLLYTLTVGGVLNAVLVPQIVRATKQPDGGREFVNRLVTWSLVIIAGVTVAATVATPWLIPLQVDNDNPRFLNLTVAMAYWCVPQIMFYGLYAVFGQYLNARGRFGAYMWSPVVANVVQLAGIGLFLALYGPAGRATTPSVPGPPR